MSEPRRYEGNGVTCADALESMMHGCGLLPPMALWWWGCALKYLWRWPWKNGEEDLEKARDCISRLERELAGAFDDSACEEHDPETDGRGRE